MTLIECFCESHIDNIAACLRLRPEKLIILGQAEEMSAPVKRYKKLLKQRGQRTEILTCNMQGKDMEDLRRALEAQVRQEPDCVIDITGGDETVIMAVGAALSGLDQRARQRIRVERFDHEAGIVRDCLNDNRKVPAKTVRLTVEELIALHGGTIYPNAYEPSPEVRSADLQSLWELVCENPKDWNFGIMRLGEFESRSASKMEIFLPLEQLRSSISDFDAKEPVVRELLGKLRQKGIIRDQSTPDALKYTYRSPLFRYCTQKAGNVLEMKVLLEARSVLENGAPYFSDCKMSVSIDWDGVVHDPKEHVTEIRNEIDVVLMRGTTPLFVSCKNGNVEEGEPYKLHTVAERFGGPYAKEMLIVTELEQRGPFADSVLDNRAKAMKFTLETEASKLSPEGWRQVFKKAME